MKNDMITKMLKDGPEQTLTVGPLVEHLIDSGWKLGQIIFGKNEWKVPKTPSRKRTGDFEMGTITSLWH